MVSVLPERRKGASQTCWSESGWGQSVLTIHPHQCSALRSPASFAVKQPSERFSQQNVKWKLWVLFLGHSFEDTRIPSMLPFPVSQATY